MPVAVVNLASRLYILYAKIPAQLFPLPVVIAIASAVLVAFAALALLKRRWRGPASVAVAALALLVAGPQVVERNRTRWISNWNDLKPAIAAVRDRGLVELALPDAGYFAGHLVAAGNPVHAAVRSLLVEEIDALPAAQRPPYLAVLFSPGSEPSPVLRARYAPQFAKWGYTPAVEGKDGVLLRLTRRP